MRSWDRVGGMATLRCAVLFVLLPGCVALWAEPSTPSVRAIMIRAAIVRLSPDDNSDKLVTLQRGHEVSVFEKAGDWVRVLATITRLDHPDRNISGWIRDNGYVTAATPDGDQVLYGAAIEAEQQASTSGGPKGSADDARRLYYRVFDYFSKSPLAGEALYRAADIQWQIDRADADSRPSHKMAPDERIPLDEERMKLVERKFPKTRWADLAEYRLLENKLCGDWLAASKCPNIEISVYEKYAEKHPNSPKLAEAMYRAAYAQAALVDIYRVEGEDGKAVDIRWKAIDALRRLLALEAATADDKARARALLFKLENNVAVYGGKLQ